MSNSNNRLKIMDNKSFLGIGWSFPPNFNNQSANIDTVTKEVDIKQSL